MSTLFIVATPLGNKEDITERALTTLKKAPLIIAEDTRVVAQLLALYNIRGKTLRSLHEHTKAASFQKIRQHLEQGEDAALVTDAGTPGVADPGGAFVHYIVEHSPGVIITPIPGPSAVTAALSVAGFPADQFVFFGFPPHKNKRNAYFRRLAELSQEFTVVLYESSHRIAKTLSELVAVLKQEQEIMVGRELTKKFETLYYTTAGKLSTIEIKEKGEFVIVINR